MTSAWGGGVPKKQKIVMISCVSVTMTRGEGGKKFRKFCGRHLSMAPKGKSGKKSSQLVKYRDALKLIFVY